MSDSVLHVSDSEFNETVIKAKGPVLVDFWAEWCGPCKMVAPVLDAIAEDYAGKLTVFKMNVDDNLQTPQYYGVRSIPTFILFKDGEVEATIMGAKSKSEFAKFIDSNI